MKPKFLFIITYGRSGSTLLMGILNSIPSYHIIGENNNAYYYLKQFYDRMLQARANSDHMEDKYETIDSCNPWWNHFTSEELLYHIKYLMAGLIDPTSSYDVIGFKEIRYPSLKNDLSGYLRWLYSITRCRFVFLTRNLDDICKSEWYRNKTPKKVKENLLGFERRVWNHLYTYTDEEWYHITYENMIGEDLEGLFDWLGEKYDREKIRKVLEVAHGYKTTGEIRTRNNNYLKDE